MKIIKFRIDYGVDLHEVAGILMDNNYKVWIEKKRVKIINGIPGNKYESYLCCEEMK